MFAMRGTGNLVVRQRGSLPTAAYHANCGRDSEDAATETTQPTRMEAVHAAKARKQVLFVLRWMSPLLMMGSRPGTVGVAV
jgi:hypothetical protein